MSAPGRLAGLIAVLLTALVLFACSTNSPTPTLPLASPAMPTLAQPGPVATNSPAASPTQVPRQLPTLIATVAALPKTLTDQVVLAAGDIVVCGGKPDEATAALVARTPGTVLTIGDSVYPSGSATQFADCYNASWGKVKDRTHPVPGNHEYFTPGAGGYFGYFGAAAGPAGKGYYSFDLGAWHLVALNSEIDVAAGSAQEKWLSADLAAHPAACTLAYWHQPRFSSGPHGSNPAYTALWQDLYTAGAEIVLNGHDHDYERFSPQSPDGQADPARGIREFVVGTGGADLYPFPLIARNSDVRGNGTWGVLKLVLHSSGYDWQFMRAAGANFEDSGHGDCH